MNEHSCPDMNTWNLSVRFWGSINYGPTFAIPYSSDDAFNSIEVYCVEGSQRLFEKCYRAITSPFVKFDGLNNSQKHRLGLRHLDDKDTAELTIKGILLQIDDHMLVIPVLVTILIILRHFVLDCRK